MKLIKMPRPIGLKPYKKKIKTKKVSTKLKKQRKDYYKSHKSQIKKAAKKWKDKHPTRIKKYT